MPQSGPATILVVDDDPMVRVMTEQMLTRFGYKVIALAAGQDAVRLFETRADLSIHLAVVDVVMQDMSGPEVADEIRRMRPVLPVLFMTGFPDQFDALRERGQPVLRKPFTSLTLIRKVREVLRREIAQSMSNSPQ